METPQIIELLKKADTAIHEQYKPLDNEQSIAALAIEKIRELEDTVESCKLTLETISRESGMDLNKLVCWKLINQVTSM